MILPLDKRPVIVALAGSNGAGKTTFYHAHLQPSGLPLINADILARDLGVDAYDAAKIHRHHHQGVEDRQGRRL